MTDLTGKAILVTGGTSGIGRGVVDAAASAGARVVFTGRRAELGQSVETGIRQAGGEAFFMRADVTRESETERLVAATLDRFGRLDGACNNARLEWSGSVLDTTEDDYRRIFDVNLWGIACALKHEARAMRDRAAGSIVNVSSIVGHVGFPNTGLYNASKHAVEGLTKTAALELARDCIRVNAVAPAFIATPMVERFAGTEGEARDASLTPILSAGSARCEK